MKIIPPTLPASYHPDEEDLWFLPGPAEDEGADLPAGLPPLPVAPRQPALDLSEWQAAEQVLAPDLAALAQDLGRLEERLAVMGAGAALRLASAEALALGWWTGDRISPDRLALWLSFRLGATGEDAQGLARVSWAARRLAAGQGAGPGFGLAEILSLSGLDTGWIGDAAAALELLRPLHPVTRAAAAFRCWQQLEERPDHLRGLEAAVLGARIGGGGRLPFLPLSLAGFGALTASGSAERRLAGWLTGAHQAVLSALMQLDRLRQWHLRASDAVAGLQGRTPPLLIGCLLRHPMISAPQAQEETGASRAAVERNLTLLQSRGLIREVTGAGRFRVWTASGV